MLTQPAAIMVVTLVVVLVGCASNACTANDLKVLFRDFSYVGIFAADKDHPIPSHGIESLSMPTSLRPGCRYVFHTSETVTTQRVAIVVLPERLRAAHFSVIQQPLSAGDFAVPNHGGPLWEIRFKKGNCRGRIYNRIDDSLFASRRNWPTGSQDDYILEIED